MYLATARRKELAMATLTTKYGSYNMPWEDAWKAAGELIRDQKREKDLAAEAEAEAAGSVFGLIVEGVCEPEVFCPHGERHEREAPAEKRVDPRFEGIIKWLANHKGEILEPKDVVTPVIGKIVDVERILHWTPLSGGEKPKKALHSKLVVAVETPKGTALVNIRGALWAHIGCITDGRVLKLKETLPKTPIDVTDDKALHAWFLAAGLIPSRPRMP